MSNNGLSQDGERDHSNHSNNSHLPHFHNPTESGYTSAQSPVARHHHNRVPSFSNSNDFLPLSKMNRLDYEEIME